MPETTIERTTTDDEVIETTTTVERRPRRIDFRDILASAEVVPDDGMSESPWENCDGFEHEAEYRPYLGHDDAKNARGYGWSDWNRCPVLIVPEWDTAGDLRFYRDRGCSRQVAAELVAMDRRRRLDQLKEWYSDGWYWYGVQCEYMGAVSSVWGIDDPDYARDEVRLDIALEVAGELEDMGHVIVNRPESRCMNGRNRTPDDYRAMLRRNVHIFDVIPS